MGRRTVVPGAAQADPQPMGPQSGLGGARRGQDDDEGRGANVKVVVSENSYFEGLSERLRGAAAKSAPATAAPARGGMADIGGGSANVGGAGDLPAKPKQVIYNDDGSIYRPGQ